MSVGMLYTPRSETLLGDAAKVQAKAGTFIAGLKTALSDSGITASVAQAGAAFKISQDFDGKDVANLNKCLDWVRSDKESTDWRDQNKADLISCIVEGDPSGFGVVGMGAVLNDVKGNKGAFYNCVWHSTTDITFSHEVGHNMGLGHEPGNGDGVLKTSHGNHFTHNGEGYTTIMAYQKQGFMKQANIFAGPNSKFNGTTTGTAATDAVGTIKQTSVPISEYYK